MKEIYRYYPPILGGRRITNKDLIIDGFRIPEKYSIIYLTHSANRDIAVYEDGDKFKWERWIDIKESPSIFTFGSGGRNCIGMQMVTVIIEVSSSKHTQ